MEEAFRRILEGSGPDRLAQLHSSLSEVVEIERWSRELGYGRLRADSELIESRAMCDVLEQLLSEAKVKFTPVDWTFLTTLKPS